MADMSLALAGVGAVSSAIATYSANQVAGIQANAANVIRAGNNKVTKATNARNAVLTDTQRWAQGVRNRRVYESVGAQQEALAVNFNRARDTRTRQNFATNIRQAEESGRQAAGAAASGITGSVVDIIDMTTQLRNGMQNEARLQAENQIVGDFKRTEVRQRLALTDQLDFSVIFDNPAILDAGTNVAQTSSVFSAAFAGAASSLLKTGITENTFSFNFGATSDDGSYDRLETQRLNNLNP